MTESIIRSRRSFFQYCMQSTAHMFSLNTHTHTLFSQFLSLFTLDYLGSSRVDSLMRVQKVHVNVHSPPLTSPNMLRASISPQLSQV